MNFERLNSINFKENYYIKEEYPTITLTHLPQEMLMQIKRMYSGNKSTLTAFNQYTYQYLVIWSNPKLNILSSIMKDIAQSQIDTYEMLAKILVKCGIDPKNCIYIDGNPNLCDYWKSSNVSYEKSLVKMFENNISLVKRMISEYNVILEKTDNDNLKAIFLRILKQETENLKCFTDLLNILKN